MFWLYLRRNHHYYFVRNIVFSAMALALIGYILFPTAPPRMLTDLGFIDTLEKTADVNFNTGAVSLLSNPFAAVPSVHTCFSLIIGTSCFFLVRRPAIRLLWLLYPCLIVFSIVATGNHFWLGRDPGRLPGRRRPRRRLDDRALPPHAAGLGSPPACGLIRPPDRDLRHRMHLIARVV